MMFDKSLTGKTWTKYEFDFNLMFDVKSPQGNFAESGSTDYNIWVVCEFCKYITPEVVTAEST